MTPIVISWIGFHGRSASIARALDGDAVFIHSSGALPLRYLKQYRETVRVAKESRKRPTIVMLPPVPALIATIQGFGKSSTHQVWADLHTGVFEDPRWAWARRLTLRMIRQRCAGAIVTNETLATRARDAGVDRTFTLDDVLEARPRRGGAATIVFPVTYDNDEPIHEILEAAARVPEVDWVLTGKAPESVIRAAPENVRFSGFIPRQEFELLLENTSAIGALTNRPFTMQRAGYEALELGTPLLTSGTDDLRAYFGDAAVYTDQNNSPESIADGVRRLFAQNEDYATAMTQLRSSKLIEQDRRLSHLAKTFATITRRAT